MICSKISKYRIKQFEKPFRKLQLIDKDWVEAACYADGGICSHINFVVMYLIQAEYESDLFREYCGCVLKKSWSDGDKLFCQYPIGAPENRKKAVKKIIQCYCGVYKQIVFFAATEQHLKEIKALYGDQVTEVRLDPDSQDYILDVKEQILLEGPQYHNRRKKIARFNRKYSCTYEPITKENMEECLAVNGLWYTAKERDSSAEREQRSLQLALKEIAELGIDGELCRIDGKPVSIYLGTPLNKSIYYGLYMKADTSYPDISLAVEQAFLEHYCSSYTYSNEGCDLGLPGLRKFKENMHLVMMAEFYYITVDTHKN